MPEPDPVAAAVAAAMAALVSAIREQLRAEMPTRGTRTGPRRGLGADTAHAAGDPSAAASEQGDRGSVGEPGGRFGR